MSDGPPMRPVYLQAESEPVFGMFHGPLKDAPDASAVLICPPFGWDEICCYRARRDWANELAAAGHPTLRIDLPSTGDSAGEPQQEARLQAWSDAVKDAATWLGSAAPGRRVAAIGISLGGLIACRALAEGAQIDELILWGVPARGRSFVRETRAFARMEDNVGPGGAEEASQYLPDGFIWAGGFLLSAETVAALEACDISGLALPQSAGRRALLLERDGIGPDGRLREHLAAEGIQTDVAPGPGYGTMMEKPHLSRPPLEVFARVSAWLAEGRPQAHEVSDGPRRTEQHELPAAAEMRVGGTFVLETPVSISQPFGELFGIITEPKGARTPGICALMLNAGAIRRVGPNRMWVEAARRWAAEGIPTMRLDLEGIGDADGDAEQFTELSALYAPERVDQVRAAIDDLQERGFGDRYVLAGLCSGAYWAFHAAIRDERVSAALLLNPRALFWDPWIEAARDYRRGVLRMSTWPRLFRGEIPLSRILALARQAPVTLPREALARRRERRAGGDELDQALDRLRDTDKQLTFLFTDNEPLREELEREERLTDAGRWPNIEVGYLPGDVHTLRPFVTQRAANEALDRALREEIQRPRAAIARAPSSTDEIYRSDKLPRRS